MTLNLMIINQAGIWQSSDFRLSDPISGRLRDDNSVKQVVLKCSDGVAAIAYAGIGAVRSIQISDWIRQILRGESRTVDQSLVFLRQHATADLGVIAESKYHHVFTIGAFINGKPWCVQIRNFDVLSSGEWESPTREFTTVAQQVDYKGQCFVLGPPSAVTSKDRTKLAQVMNLTPRTPKEFSNLLATINRRASQTSAGSKYISSHCVTIYVPPTGAPCNQEIHDKKGSFSPSVVPFLLFGVDTTETEKLLLNTLIDRVQSGSTPDIDEQLNRTSQESVKPKNPLQKR